MENAMTTRRGVLAATLVSALAATPTWAQTQTEELRVGVLATLEGAMTALGSESMRGVRLALGEVNNTIAGKKVVLFTGPTNSTPDSAINAARRLIEQDRVQVVI